ncbi:MAG: hypothetical protein RLZZ141_2140 [Pseudomonadota bacterium]
MCCQSICGQTYLSAIDDHLSAQALLQRSGAFKVIAMVTNYDWPRITLSATQSRSSEMTPKGADGFDTPPRQERVLVQGAMMMTTSRITC